jgi:hypothetical protein
MSFLKIWPPWLDFSLCYWIQVPYAFSCFLGKKFVNYTIALFLDMEAWLEFV